MTPVFALCDDYIERWAALDPVAAGMRGLATPFAAATDYSPGGYAARAELISATLAALDRTAVTSEADRLAASHLRERLEAQAAWHQAGEPLRLLQTPFGLIASIRDSADLLPRGGAAGDSAGGAAGDGAADGAGDSAADSSADRAGDGRDDGEAWRNIAGRLAAIPVMFAGWRQSLEAGLAHGLPAARRQAVEAAGQAERYARTRTHDALVAAYGDGPLAGDLAAAAATAYEGYAAIARYLREDYAPRAAARDAAGAERYAIAARLSLGADVDLAEAYEWGWAELERIEAEMVAEAGRVRPGASIAEASAILDESRHVTGEDAYRAWLQDRHDEAIERLNGTHFDIAEPLRRVEVVIAPGSTAGAAYYTPPSEDLARPGRTWWPLGGRDRFATWSDLTVVFHEGVPGHHLQVGAARVAGNALSRFARSSFVSGHGEGWALYAERLADELGWFTEPGTRLGMLAGSAIRAARVVIDIGVHLDLPLPDGSRWTFGTACEVLRDRGRAEPYRVRSEVVRYFGMPAQAISYKLGERAWLAAREEASARPGFDLKRWHTAALGLGPIGLRGLADALRRIGGPAEGGEAGPLAHLAPSDGASYANGPASGPLRGGSGRPISRPEHRGSYGPVRRCDGRVLRLGWRRRLTVALSGGALTCRPGRGGVCVRRRGFVRSLHHNARKVPWPLRCQ
ncbi:MAG: DUF885 domain-containing protein [Streptosporangiaceae bacterium]|nr:DUF885 domain-containing protein [Streptosporangiaceae bacterium]MBV9855674.1 DUF885 domain-containing protein [Streptosporangiaceae bacterium]